MFYEVLIILAHSDRMKAALGLGVLFSIGLMLAGAYYEANPIELKTLGPAADAINELLIKRYHKGAMTIMGASLFAAYRIYKKERKKLFG